MINDTFTLITTIIKQTRILVEGRVGGGRALLQVHGMVETLSKIIKRPSKNVYDINTGDERCMKVKTLIFISKKL